MADYISREAASDLLAMALIDDWEPEYAQDRLSEIPAADVRQVVKGELVNPYMEEYYGEWHHCSVCGAGGLGLGDNFCPNCGADMREVTP